jgi:hypothetical protein
MRHCELSKKAWQSISNHINLLKPYKICLLRQPLILLAPVILIRVNNLSLLNRARRKKSGCLSKQISISAQLKQQSQKKEMLQASPLKL